MRGILPQITAILLFGAMFVCLQYDRTIMTMVKRKIEYIKVIGALIVFSAALYVMGSLFAGGFGAHHSPGKKYAHCEVDWDGRSNSEVCD